MLLQSIHHIAVICSDYKKSKQFYVHALGLTVIREVYRKERESYKLDLALHGEYVLELFSFPNPPPRASRPESCGLRHLAFAVDNIDLSMALLLENGIEAEQIRVDEFTGKRFTFIFDPDQLPIELYER